MSNRKSKRKPDVRQQRHVSLGDRLKRKSSPVTEQGCILWLGSLRNGYGQIEGEPHENCTLHTHRVAWTLANGPIPTGLLVLHKCDVRNCINPDHLFLGTSQDNTNDKLQKGRQSNGGGKLDAESVRKIRDLYKKLSQVQLARDYRVSPNTIWKIVHRIIWKHV